MDRDNKTFPQGLNIKNGCGKINAEQRWLLCPACGKAKVLKLLPGTRVQNLPVYCRQCRKETIVNIPESLSL